MLTTLTAMFGTTVISTAVLMSISKATSGVEIRGKPKPIAPCVMAPTMTMAASAAIIAGANKVSSPNIGLPDVAKLRLYRERIGAA